MSETAAQVWKDRYEIERPLGKGGMSAVYLAKDRQLLSKRVVVKVLLEEMDEDAWMRQKFLQEMEALARIDHPGVVGVLDTGQTPEGKQFLVMQYVEGETLRKAIPAEGMPFERAASLIRQIAQALGAAHDAGVWHRDLKPENIMLQRSGGEDYAKLIDFGIAGIQNSQFTGEKTKVAGSLSYMAPEQFAGNPCAASDTYALGVVAYEMLTGKPPFASSSMTHLVADDQTMTLPRAARPDLPEAAERALMKALAFRPEDRPATVRELGEQLYSALCEVSEPTRKTFEEPTRRTAKSGSEPTLEMANVLFTDLVGYSMLPMDKQKQYLAELQTVVKASPRLRAAERAGDLISLPTGDGMALVFFGDPSTAAQCAIEVGAGLKSKPHLKLRMGIHAGPVYRVADINANANVAGGGINIAQRVMDCGDAGHILVSKTAADVLMQLSDWAPCLCDLGEHAVKHGVKVHIYNLATAEAGNAERPSKLAAAVAAPAKKSKAGLVAAVLAVAAIGGTAGWMATREKPPAAAPVPAPAAPTATLQLSYRMEFAEPNKVAFRVVASANGYLYVFSYSFDPRFRRPTFRLLHPRTGSAEWKKAEALRVPPSNWFVAENAGEKDLAFLLWSAEALPRAEMIQMLPRDKEDGLITISEPGQIAALQEFLNSHRSEATAKDGQVEVRTTDKVLVHAIVLEKR